MAEGCGWARLAPQDLLHERAELGEGDFAWRRGFDLREHRLEFLVAEVLAFAAEAFLEVGLCDEARVAYIEMMEGKRQVRLGDRLSTVNGDCEELGVVDLAVVVEVDSLKDLIDFLLAHVQLIEGLSDFTEL